MSNSSWFLYLDESGDFEPAQAAGNHRPSVIAGVLSPTRLDEDAAWAFLQDVTGHARGPQFHATDHPPDVRTGWIPPLADALAARRWELVAFVHDSGAEILDNATTYVNVVAEGAMQLLADLAVEIQGGVELHILAARRMVPDGPEALRQIKRDAYTSRLAERLAIERVRTSPSLRRSVEATLAIGSARDDPRLMVADLVSNLWFNLRHLKAEPRRQLRDCFGHRVYRTLRPEAEERLRHLIHAGNLGAALHESLLAEMQRPSGQQASADHTRLLGRLAALPGEALDRELGAALARTEARIDQRLALDHITAEVDACRRAVIEPLAARLPPLDAARLGWVDGRLLRDLITAANHAGALALAAAACERIGDVRRELGGQFVHLPLMLELSFAEAVHLTDACALELACQRMDELAAELEPLLDMLQSGLWGVERTTGPRSALLGKAVGTSLQAWAKRGARDRRAFAQARARSDRALTLFSAGDDLRRQHGYRCQLEADAGDLVAAKRSLAASLDLDPAAPHTPMELLAAAVASPWTVMYWAHVWYRVSLGGAAERSAWLAAWNHHQLASKSDWLLDASFRDPGHRVAWKAGAAAWRCGSATAGEELLSRSIRACFANGSTEVFQLIGLGALAERASLGDDRSRRRDVAELERRHATMLAIDGLPAPLVGYLAPWTEQLRQNADPLAVTRTLERLANEVCF